MAPRGSMTCKHGPILDNNVQMTLDCSCNIVRIDNFHSIISVYKGLDEFGNICGITTCAKWDAPNIICANRLTPACTFRSDPYMLLTK